MQSTPPGVASSEVLDAGDRNSYFNVSDLSSMLTYTMIKTQ